MGVGCGGRYFTAAIYVVQSAITRFCISNYPTSHLRHIICSLGGPPQSTMRNKWTPRGTQECEALLYHQASTGKLLNVNTCMHTSGHTTTHSFFIYICNIVQSAIAQICISDYPVSHLNSTTNNIKVHHVFTRWTTTAHAEEQMDLRGYYVRRCMCSLGGLPQPPPRTNGPEREPRSMKHCWTNQASTGKLLA